MTIKQVSGGNLRLDNIVLQFNTPMPFPDLSTATFGVPEYVYNITNQDHHADTAVDMVIIIPTSQKLLAQAQRIKAFHESHDSLRVRIVPADELFNEFSSGTPDANAAVICGCSMTVPRPQPTCPAICCSSATGSGTTAC